MKKNKLSNTWLYVVSFFIMVLVVAQIISSRLINDTSIDSRIDGTFAGIVSLFAFTTFVVSLIAVFKTQSWSRLLPIVGILVSMTIFALAFFAFGFSGYGSPY